MEDFKTLNGNSEGGGRFAKSISMPSEGDTNQRVDFVLVWNSEEEPIPFDEKDEYLNRILRRETFERNLTNEGLILTTVNSPEGCATGMNFVKITAPTEVLERYAEILKLRLPMKKVSFNTNL